MRFLKLGFSLCSFIFIMNNSFAQFDANFGSSGKVILTDSYHTDSYQSDMQSTGKLIVVGGIVTPLTFVGNIKIVRLNDNGTLDATFDTDGVLIIDLPAITEDAKCVKVLSNDKIIVAGVYADGSPSNYPFVLRLNSDGTMDNSFDSDGYTTILGMYVPRDIVIQNDGKIVILTTSGLFRLNTDGSLDTSFDTDGKFEFNIDFFTPNGLALQSDGKFLVAGGFDDNSVILRINSNGTFDASFGMSGIVTLNINTSNDDIAKSICVLEDGNIVIAGNATGQAYVAKLNATDGSLNTSFSLDGIETFIFTGALNSLLSSIKEDTVTNDIIVAGTGLYGTKGFFVMARFSVAGSNEAIVAAQMDEGTSEVRNIYIQPDRKIVLTGYSYDNSDQTNFTLARFVPDFNTLISSVTSADINLGINLFPNPASHSINVHSTNSIENIRVVDLMGIEILKVNASGNTHLDISSLPKGLYNFVITTDKGTGTKKISIQ